MREKICASFPNSPKIRVNNPKKKQKYEFEVVCVGSFSAHLKRGKNVKHNIF